MIENARKIQGIANREKKFNYSIYSEIKNELVNRPDLQIIFDAGVHLGELWAIMICEKQHKDVPQ